jgi:hypothetical protein
VEKQNGFGIFYFSDVTYYIFLHLGAPFKNNFMTLTGTNTPAYYALPSAVKKKSFVTFLFSNVAFYIFDN